MWRCQQACSMCFGKFTFLVLIYALCSNLFCWIVSDAQLIKGASLFLPFFVGVEAAVIAGGNKAPPIAISNSKSPSQKISGNNGHYEDVHLSEIPGQSLNELLAAIFGNYHKELVPKRPTVVKLDLLLLKVKSTIEKEGIFESVVALFIEWQDERLLWNPMDYDNVSILAFDSDKVWLPDIAMTNSADHLYSISKDTRFVVRVSHDGVMKFVPTGTARTWCDLRLLTFPFDIQTCSLEFESWSLDSSTMSFNTSSDALVDDAFSSPQWALCYRKAIVYDHFYNFTGETFTRVRFDFMVRRKSTFYVINLIFPVFVIPSTDSTSDRVGFGTTNLLTLVVFQTIVTEEMPKSSDAVTALSKYIISLIIIAAVGIFESVVVERMLRTTLNPPPNWASNLMHFVPLLWSPQMPNTLTPIITETIHPVEFDNPAQNLDRNDSNKRSSVVLLYGPSSRGLRRRASVVDTRYLQLLGRPRPPSLEQSISSPADSVDCSERQVQCDNTPRTKDRNDAAVSKVNNGYFLNGNCAHATREGKNGDPPTIIISKAIDQLDPGHINHQQRKKSEVSAWNRKNTMFGKLKKGLKPRSSCRPRRPTSLNILKHDPLPNISSDIQRDSLLPMFLESRQKGQSPTTKVNFNFKREKSFIFSSLTNRIGKTIGPLAPSGVSLDGSLEADSIHSGLSRGQYMMSPRLPVMNIAVLSRNSGQNALHSNNSDQDNKIAHINSSSNCDDTMNSSDINEEQKSINGCIEINANYMIKNKQNTADYSDSVLNGNIRNSNSNNFRLLSLSPSDCNVTSFTETASHNSISDFHDKNLQTGNVGENDKRVDSLNVAISSSPYVTRKKQEKRFGKRSDNDIGLDTRIPLNANSSFNARTSFGNDEAEGCNDQLIRTNNGQMWGAFVTKLDSLTFLTCTVLAISIPTILFIPLVWTNSDMDKCPLQHDF